MGNFYTNYSLPGVTPSAVAAALAGRSALVSPSVNNVVVVFDEQSESQDIEVMTQLGAELSSKCKCPVLAAMNHDDDVLWYGLFQNGQLVDEYNSCPGYFDDSVESDEPSGGDAEKLASAFGVKKSGPVKKVLRASDEDYTFAIERHGALAKALGLPSFAVGGGYGSIDSGERPKGLTADSLLRTA